MWLRESQRAVGDHCYWGTTHSTLRYKSIRKLRQRAGQSLFLWVALRRRWQLFVGLWRGDYWELTIFSWGDLADCCAAGGQYSNKISQFKPLLWELRIQTHPELFLGTHTLFCPQSTAPVPPMGNGNHIFWFPLLCTRASWLKSREGVTSSEKAPDTAWSPSAPHCRCSHITQAPRGPFITMSGRTTCEFFRGVDSILSFHLWELGLGTGTGMGASVYLFNNGKFEWCPPGCTAVI